MNLYVVRHGQTDWNAEKRRQGRTDIPLNQTGIAQAEALREKIKDLHFDLCLSSPLSRAKKTAEIICDGRCQIIEEPLLLEICMGKMEGMKRADVPAEELAKEVQLGATYNDDETHETLEQILERAKLALEEIKKYDVANLLVVSHGFFLKALNFVIEGYDENTDFLSWHLENCEIHKYHI